MRIQGSGAGFMGATRVMYINDDGYYIKQVHTANLTTNPPVLPKLIEYDWFDFDKFIESDVTAEIIEGDHYSVFKLAIPKGFDRVNVFINTSIVYRLYPSTRELKFNSVISMYSLDDDYPKYYGDTVPQMLVHLSNVTNPHADQVVKVTPQLLAGNLIGKDYVTQLTNRYDGVISGSTLITEDGCKYWLGNFSGSQYGS